MIRLNKGTQKYLFTAIAYISFTFLFFTLRSLASSYQIEYRFWVNFIALGIIWCVPFFYIGSLILLLFRTLHASSPSKLFLLTGRILFGIYFFLSVIVLLLAGIVGLFRMRNSICASP